MPVTFSISKTLRNGSWPFSHLSTVDLSTAGFSSRPNASSDMSPFSFRYLVIGDLAMSDSCIVCNQAQEGILHFLLTPKTVNFPIVAI